MIQLVRATSLQFKLVYLNLYDKMTNADYRPLITFTSQLTGNSKTFLPASASYVNKDRYVSLLIYTQFNSANENLYKVEIRNFLKILFKVVFILMYRQEYYMNLKVGTQII